MATRIATAALGLVTGAVLAAAIGTVMVLARPGLGVASPEALILGPLLLLAHGFVWALLGGLLFVFPLAVVAFALQPPNTRAGALAVSALLLAALLLVGFPAAPSTA